ncbi:MAG: DUF1971 domain-containing protein [Deltaproteobacteria bacterium]|nr:MAG: DUF1971 domain-containing protein [Deltaproteobacteria bacterium]
MSPTPLQRFAAKRREAAAVLEALATAAAQVGPATERFVSPLGRGAQRTREGRFVVLLIGCFSSGKSSLLNALLGQPVLPVKVNPCTAILTELRHGEAPSVEVLRHDGSAKTLGPEAFLAEYQLETPEPSAEALDRFAEIDRAIVRWPLPLLRDGVALVDTPGLDDDPARTARTLRSLPEADAVIFVLNATRFLTELERHTLERELLPLGLTNLFFPVTMIDLLHALSDQPEQDRTELYRRAREALEPLCEVEGHQRFDERFFPLNARGALQARWTGQARREPLDHQALQASGIAPFEASLERFLVHERGRAQLLRSLHLARATLDGVERQAALDRATAKASVEELRARQAALAPQLDALDQVAERVDDTVQRFVDRQATRTWQSLRTTLSRAEAELPEAVGELDLGAVAALDLLTPAGRARVERTLHREIERWLQDWLDTWRKELEGEIERALASLRVELATEAQDFDLLTTDILSGFAGSTVDLPLSDLGADDPDPLERWFSVALGAVLLSPGTMAAGWTQGYEGALKGAASRVAVRVAILAIGVFLGPVGWAGLVLYAVSDAALLVLTGGGQLRRLRRQVAESLQGRLVAQADAVRDEVELRVRESFGPLHEALVGAARSEAEELRIALEQAVRAREKAIADATARDQTWRRTLGELRAGVERLQELVGPDPRRTPTRILTFKAKEIPEGLLREHNLKAGTWGLLELLSGELTFIDDREQRTSMVAGDSIVVPPVLPHRIEPSEDAAIRISFFAAPPLPQS